MFCAFRKNEAAVEADDMPKTSRVHGYAPQKPNVFSDGSLAGPADWRFSVGGAGSWWPGADRLEECTGEIEHYGHREIEEEWISFNIHSNGTRLS